MGSDKPVWRVPSPEESKGILQHRVIAADFWQEWFPDALQMKINKL